MLYVLESQDQAALLIASLQEKTTYRLALFLFGDSKARNIL